jgi:hypothetical protein
MHRGGDPPKLINAHDEIIPQVKKFLQKGNEHSG